MILGFVKGKPMDQILPLFPADAVYYIAPLRIERGMEVQPLAAHFEEHNLVFTQHASVKEALDAALLESHPDDLIFVGGSTFTVAEVL